MKLLRKFQDLRIEGEKARQYDEFSRQYRMKELREYASLVSHHVPESGLILEIASGPGYFATELAKLGNYKITGVDISNAASGLRTRLCRLSVLSTQIGWSKSKRMRSWRISNP